MTKNTSSQTAFKVAAMRAAHQILDHPTVFEDPIALKILGSQAVSDIYAGRHKLQRKLHRYLRAIVVARSRYAEQELASAVASGVRQYVILGAGLDTFAYRNCTSSLNLFEVDHPRTQAWKCRQLERANIPVPDALRFVPVDFEAQSLTDQLLKSGFRTDIPSFFSLLGVTMYLTHDSVNATLKDIFSLIHPDGTIVFDYAVPPSSQGILRRLVFGLLARKLKKSGEPWQSFFEPESIITELRTIGFNRVKDLGPEQINARFFKEREDGLMVGNFGHLVTAGP